MLIRYQGGQLPVSPCKQTRRFDEDNAARSGPLDTRTIYIEEVPRRASAENDQWASESLALPLPVQLIWLPRKKWGQCLQCPLFAIPHPTLAGPGGLYEEHLLYTSRNHTSGGYANGKHRVDYDRRASPTWTCNSESAVDLGSSVGRRPKQLIAGSTYVVLERQPRMSLIQGHFACDDALSKWSSFVWLVLPRLCLGNPESRRSGDPVIRSNLMDGKLT
ncbi:hypothetical protein GGX14DRAFT_661486 [Mycena pura]|uniref:Uncharacterized protein n=1 Tax=Mycena pura TaxID=153505 RepID=A0AAD6V7Z2_9AGAR|nr:hypothetical protein GGX14DRAFT_661486 [Mycena pura]